MGVQINFVLDQGTTFNAVVTVLNEDGTVFDLTDLAARSQMRKSYYTNTFIELTATVDGDPTDGKIRLSLLPTQTDAIRAGRYVYDVEVHNVDGDYVKRVMQGIITVSPQVTRPALA